MLYVVGRNQWFIRDDWAFVFTREKLHQASGLDDMLFMAQDGHWMTIPDHHLPHHPRPLRHRLVLAVPDPDDGVPPGRSWCMVRKLSLRAGVTPWTATILAGTLAVFGSGWENIVFAIQLVYNLSLLAFLVQILLIDHDGPPDRRDALRRRRRSRGRGVVGIRTVLHRRDAAVHGAAAPVDGRGDRRRSHALASAWWWLFWGRDPAGEALARSFSQMPAYVNRGLTAVFQGLTSTASLVGISHDRHAGGPALAHAATRAAHDLMLSLAVTAVLIYVGLGIERGGFGVETAANSRYVYVGRRAADPGLRGRRRPTGRASARPRSGQVACC